MHGPPVNSILKIDNILWKVMLILLTNILWVSVMVFNATFNIYFSYIMAVCFIGGGNQSTLRRPSTFRMSLTHIIT
jgi:hypothetical protein